MTSHAEELARVQRRIAPLILAYEQANPNKRFHAEDLHRFVQHYDPVIAPASADRVLRALRKQKKLSYVMLNRHQSLYQFISKGVNMNKPFSWSWSRLKNWRTCPKRFYEIDVAKNYVEPEAGALKWGHEVHEALAKRIAKVAPLPEAMQDYDEWPQKMIAMRDAGARMLVENKLAMSQEFAPTKFFDNDTWFRGVVDVLGIGKETAISLDWKTGKVSPEFEQLGLSAQLVFANYPAINEVQTAYIWLGHTDDNGQVLTTKGTYKRDEMVPLWNSLWPEIKTMTEAHRTTTYPPKPSGLCVRHCPVDSCPYHGKGSR